MKRTAVGGRESQVQPNLVGVVDAGGAAGRGVGALQGLDRAGRGVPLEASSLVDHQARLRKRHQVGSAVPSEQVIAVRAVRAHPGALRRLAVGESARSRGRSQVGRPGITASVARDDPIEVGGGGGEPTIGEGGAGTGPDLGPTGAAVGRTLDLVCGGSAGTGPAQADVSRIESAGDKTGWRRRWRDRCAPGGDREVLRLPLREAEDPRADQLVATPHDPGVGRVGRGPGVVAPAAWVDRAVVLEGGLLVGIAARAKEDLACIHLAQRGRLGAGLRTYQRQERSASAVVGDHRVVARRRRRDGGVPVEVARARELALLANRQ